MAPERLAQIRSSPAAQARTIKFAALRAGDQPLHDVLFARLYPDRIETPASTPDATHASYCTGRAEMFDALDLFVEPPVDALFDIDQVLAWLDWLEGGAESVTTTFEGDPATGVAERIVYEADDVAVTVPCDADWTHDEVSLSLPERFRDGHFLDGGEPVPTRVRTTAATLDRLVTASDAVGPEGNYAVVVADGELRLDLDGADGTRATGTLPAEVEGPDVATSVGPAFRSVVSSLVGPVELQTGPTAPLAIVREHEAFTLRFVIAPE